MGTSVGRRWALGVLMTAVVTVAVTACGGSSGPSAATVPRAGGSTTTTPTTVSAATTAPLTTDAAATTVAPSTTVATSTTVGPTTTAAPAQTAVETYTPWTAAGTLASGIQVSSTVQGSCFTSSISVETSGVYRCMSGNNLYDPCFTGSADSGQLACAASPWAAVTVLDAAGSLPSGGAPEALSPARPWAVQLANGAQCIVGDGANSTVGGVTLQYYCAGTAATGSVSETSQPWTVQYLPDSSSSVLTSVVVTTAWD
jgi:hypothetical protein